MKGPSNVIMHCDVIVCKYSNVITYCDVTMDNLTIVWKHAIVRLTVANKVMMSTIYIIRIMAEPYKSRVLYNCKWFPLLIID